MFDFGFSEILVAAVIGLIVIGPEKLPRVARTLGLMFGKVQRYVGDLKEDINRQAEIDEFNEIRSSVEESAAEIEESVVSSVSYVDKEVRAVGDTFNRESELRDDFKKFGADKQETNVSHSSKPRETGVLASAVRDTEASSNRSTDNAESNNLNKIPQAKSEKNKSATND